jgi:hydrogenase nickel incorporation protein HypA/HybF
MHEMSLAESVLDLVEDCIRREGGQRVKTVRLEIGKLSAVEPDAMRFCFDAVARGTSAEGAVLDIIEQEGSAWCFDCNREVPLAARYDPCTACGGFRLQVAEGTAMRVRELEIE